METYSEYQYTARFDDEMFVAFDDSYSNNLRRSWKSDCKKSGCKIENIGNGICNPECHSKACKNDEGDCDGYTIQIANFGNSAPAMQAALSNATERWRSIISDVPGVIVC